MPSSGESSQLRDRTHVSCGSCIAGGLFTTEPLGKPLCVSVCVCVCMYIYIKHVLSIYKHFLIHSSNSQHLDCFCTLAVINNILFYILVSPSYIATHSAL